MSGGDGVAAQRWPNILLLPCDLHWGCDRRHRKADRTSVCPVLSITTKQASNSSTDHGGGKRRGVIGTTVLEHCRESGSKCMWF